MTSARSLAGALLARSAGRILHVHDAQDAPFDHRAFLRHHTLGGPHSFTHYNVVIPDLPHPHRYLACMILGGKPAMPVFDIRHADAGRGRAHTTTVGVGTAATAPSWFLVYDTDHDCTASDDGARLEFGDAVTIAGEFPEFHITVDRPRLSVDIDAVCTPDVTMFADSRVYDHLAFPASYRGTLSYDGTTTGIDGVLSLEYARAVAVPVPLPADFFTYQVIKLDAETLLMLVRLEILGGPALTSGYVKTLSGRAYRQTRDVTFEVLGYRPEPKIAPDGRATRIPRTFRWTLPHLTGAGPTEITATTDTEVIYGLGRGWIGGYAYRGTHAGDPIAGEGYYEYATLRG